MFGVSQPLKGHPVIDLVSQAANDAIVALVNAEFRPVLTFQPGKKHDGRSDASTLHRAPVGQGGSGPCTGSRFGWPFPLGFGLDGRLLLARRGRA